MADFAETLAHQSWPMYGIGMFLMAVRIYARIHRIGFRNLQPDDYLMVLVTVWYTVLIACLNAIAGGGGSNLYPPEDFDTFTPQEIEERIHGSKIVVVSEQAMLNVIYSIKACMLIMYTRLTLHHTHRNLVLYLAIYVVVGWIATQIAFFTACRPFSGYWAVPPPNPQCTTLQRYAIVQGCFNISSDTLMLFIPLPLVTRLNVHWKQKIVLICIFSMGIFVIIAAILTKVFNLSDVWDTSYMLWYTREASVAVYVCNLPLIWPLMREWFPGLRSLTPGHKVTTSRGQVHGESGSARVAQATIGGRRFSETFGVKMAGVNGITTTVRGKGDDSVVELGILKQDPWDERRPGTGSGSDEERLVEGGGVIHISTTMQVSEEHIRHNGDIPRRPMDVLPVGEPGFEWGFEKGNR